MDPAPNPQPIELDAAPPDAPVPTYPRPPGSLAAAVILLWVAAAGTAGGALVHALGVYFQETVVDHDSVSASELMGSLPIAAAAPLLALLTVKFWRGRDWARQSLVIIGGVYVAVMIVAFLGLGSPASGTALLLPAIAALLLVLLNLPATRDWCDPESALHSPRAATAARPPYAVVALLLLLWAVTGLAVYAGTAVLIEATSDDGDLGDPAAWAAGASAAIAMALVHALLNLALTRRRNWARRATAALMLAYAIALATATIVAQTREGMHSGGAQILLAVVPIVFCWALLRPEIRTWCRRETRR